MPNNPWIFRTLPVFLALAAINTKFSTAIAQSTAFAYQGQLASGGALASGNYDVTFTLFATNINSTAIAGPTTNRAIWVTNGLFSTVVDFGGGVFTGSNYWLELAVQTNGGSGFTTLTPRQPVLPAPYAIYSATSGTARSVSALNINGTVPLAQLPVAVVTNGGTGLTLGGVFLGNGTGLTNLNAAQLTGTLPNASVRSNNIVSLNPAQIYPVITAGIPIAAGNNVTIANSNGTNIISTVGGNIVIPPLWEIYGDSLTGTTNPVGSVNPNPIVGPHTWVPLFFQTNTPAGLANTNVYNWASSGAGVVPVGTANNVLSIFTNGNAFSAPSIKPVPGQSRYFFLMIGVNDLAEYNSSVAGVTPTTIETNLLNIWSWARANGYTVIASTITGYNDVGNYWYNPASAMYGVLTNLNGWILSQTGSWNYCFDAYHAVSASNIVNGPHWNTAGCQQFATALNVFLSGDITWTNPVLNASELTGIPPASYVTTNYATAIGQVPTFTAAGITWQTPPGSGTPLAAGNNITVVNSNGTNVVSTASVQTSESRNLTFANPNNVFAGNFIFLDASNNQYKAVITNISGAYSLVLYPYTPPAVTNNHLLNGLVDYWKFDETSGTRADSIGSANLSEGSATVNYASGIIDNAALFNGNANDVLSGTLTAVNNSGDFAVSFWVYPTNPTFTQTWYNIADTTGNPVAQFGWNGGPSSYAYFWSNGGGAPANHTLNTSAWNNVILNFSGSSVYLYINGVFDSSSTYSPAANTASTISIGAGSGNGNTPAPGGVDEMGIWNRALTLNEITNLASAMPLSSFGQ